MGGGGGDAADNWRKKSRKKRDIYKDRDGDRELTLLKSKLFSENQLLRKMGRGQIGGDCGNYREEDQGKKLNSVTGVMDGWIFTWRLLCYPRTFSKKRFGH